MSFKRFLKTIELKYKQKYIDKKYKKEGLSDKVLELQVQLNTERHELDITDETQKIYEDFVQ